jgi:hypothetical protein
MPQVNPGPSTNTSGQSTAVMQPVNTALLPAPTGAYVLRLMGYAKGVSGNATGDAAVMNIINSGYWLPKEMVTANGAVSGVAGSIATLQLGLFTAAAAGGTAIKSNAALASNSAANSAIVTATTVANVAQTAQQIYVNVGTALANSTLDIYLYGYDLSATTVP